MKRKCKMLSAVLVLPLLLGMTGCLKKTEAPIAGNETIGGYSSAGNQETVDDFWYLDQLEKTVLLEENWISSSNLNNGFSDRGYYYGREDVLYYWDKASGETRALCTKTECFHADDPIKDRIRKCDGYVHGFYDTVGFLDGFLYYVDVDARLYRCDAAGNGKTVLCQLGEKYIQDREMIFLVDCILLNGVLYYEGSVHDYVTEGFLAGTYQQERVYIGKVDPATGKEEILIENCSSLVAVSDYGILYMAQEQVNTDPSGKIAPQTINCLRYWDKETGETQPLFWKERTYAGMILDSKVYCCSVQGSAITDYIRDYFTFDLSTGEETMLGTNNDWQSIGGGYAWQSDGTPNGCLVNLSTGKKLPCELEVGHWGINGRNGKECILHWMIPSDGVQKSEHWRCYLQYSSLADGLQESDLTCFDIWTAN